MEVCESRMVQDGIVEAIDDALAVVHTNSIRDSHHEIFDLLFGLSH